MLKFIDGLSTLTRLGIICVLMLLGLGSMLAGVARIHMTGVPVVLATAPVDPRSLFQGDYVVLNYKISQLDSTLYEGGEMPEPDDDVYVELQPGDPVWTPVRASTVPISAPAGHVVIKGHYGPSNFSLFGSAARLHYGIETFLVPEGEGAIIERMGWTERSRVTVRVLVAPDGAALPQNILVDGKPVFRDSGL